MTVPKVAAAPTAPPIDTSQSPALPHQRHVLPPTGGLTPAEQLELLPDDYHRALFCRHHAEAYRREYFAGRDREVAYVTELAQAGDPRFKGMRPFDLEITGKWRWTKSARGLHLKRLERRYTAWASMYLAFAEVQVLHQARP